MLLLEIILMFLGYVGWMLTIWAAELIPILPAFIWKFFVNNMLLYYIQNTLIFAGYLGIVLLILNILTGSKRWWMSRISAAVLLISIHYAWRVHILGM